MSDAPFVEKPVAPDSVDPAAAAARQRLQAVLDKLSPATGKIASPEPHNNKKKKKNRPPKANPAQV